MRNEQSRDVMVLGATPVGTYIASQLARQGVSVSLLDDRFETGEPRGGSVVLYPDTLARLRTAGLSEGALGDTTALETVTIYEGEERKASLPLGGPDLLFPRVVSRAGLDAALGRELADQHLKVQLRRRLVGLRTRPDGVELKVAKLQREAAGYSVMTMEEVVGKELQERAAWVVGADGEDSVVRARLDVELEAMGERALYATVEFASPGPTEAREMRILFAGDLTGTCVPTPAGGHRWAFLIPDAEGFREQLRKIKPEPTVRHLLTLLSARLPYVKLNADDLVFADVEHTEPSIASRFIHGHVLLAGEAAHRVDPLGDRDINEGLSAADVLIAQIRDAVLREPPEASEAYEAEVKQQLAPTLSVGRSFDATRANDPWIAAHFERFAPMLPAEGAELERISERLGIPRHRVS